MNDNSVFIKSLHTLQLHAAKDTTCAICKQSNNFTVSQRAGLGHQAGDFFSGLLDTKDWPPRWHCGNWSDFHGWLYIISDLMIWASYFAIPILIIRVLTKRSDIPIPSILWLFVAFIILCGTTHLMDAIIFWWPAYRLSALLRFMTGLVSAFTVFALYRALPLVFSLRSVKELEREIIQRKLAEERLSESHQQLKTFTHILSHNIRNHSSNISLLSGLIDIDTLDEGNSDVFRKLTRVSGGLNQTLNDLSEAIKIRESKLDSESIFFEDIVAHVVGILESEIISTHTTLSLEFGVDSIFYPKIYLESILINLISNAIKYRSDDKPPEIKLRTYLENMRLVLECTDNGLGIDLKLYGGKIFGLYKTFHAHQDAHGVGLFLVKTQVESQGGSIKVESTPGSGSTFRIIF